MSQLPEIDYNKVSQKLAAKYSEASFQIAQLESLAEQFRDERDVAQNDAAQLRVEVQRLQDALDATSEDE